MERIQYDGQHDYMLTPNNYSISSNDADSTYDQFLTLRETLIYTGKFYNNKASKKLCVGDKGDGTTTNTIEVWLPNIFRQSFNNDWSSTSVEPLLLGSYISKIPSDLVSTMGNLACLIKKDGRYRITHKEEILLSTSTNKVYCYVDVYRKDANNQYKVAIKGGICVFDWEGTGTYYTLGQLFKKMTASGYIETDLFKDDILVLRMRDEDYNSSTGEPQGNNLTIQNNSNYWNIEYLDLPYNN